MAYNRIFEKFKFYLGARCIDWNGTFNIYITPLLDHLECAKWDPLGADVKGKTWKSVVLEKKFIRIGQLHNLNIDSINKITNMASETSYDELHNLPCRAHIFSKECPNTCYVKKDWEYEAVGSTPEEADKNYEKQLNTEYWDLNYGFYDHFDQEEYDLYGIKADMITENIMRVMPGENVIFATKDVNTTDANTHIAGYGVLIDTRLKTAKTVVPESGEDMADQHVPVLYIEFDRYHDSKNGTMNITWNQNGFLRVE